jgi:multiple sugar transport system permease protein/alpha-1,4-digalacturonate transport system permease protein
MDIAIPRRQARRQEGSPGRRPGGVGRVVRWRLAALGALVFAFPLYWMVVTAITPVATLRAGEYTLIPTEFAWDNLSRAWNAFPFDRWFANSVVIAVAAVILTVSINLVAGYAFAKLRFPGRNLLFILIVSTLIIPVQVLMVPQFSIVADLGWTNNYLGIIIPRAAEAFGIFFARQYYRSIPDELIEAARIDGASELTILRRIVLPLSKPLIAVLIIFTFMWRWNEFAWPLIVLRDSDAYTLPIGLLFLQNITGTDITSVMTLTFVSVLPMMVIFIFFQRYFVEGMTRSGLK